MAIAISIKAANDTAAAIEALWQQAACFEDAPSMRALSYPPHITLAIYDDIEPERVASALEAVFLGKSALRITFGELRHFEGTPLVLWAAPSVCVALDQAHAVLHRLVDPALCRPHYRPDVWVPHCTLAAQVKSERRDEALAFVSRPIAPFEVVFDMADCVSFPPVAVLRECALSPA
jgi:2'-5' RNA ligase